MKIELNLLALAAFLSLGTNASADPDPNFYLFLCLGQKNTESLIPFGARLNSPDVRDDGTVTFRLRAAGAKDVRLTDAVLTALELDL